MTSITLDLTFSGICLLVPRPVDDRVSVLVPDATVARKALDDQDLTPHFSALVHTVDGTPHHYALPRLLTVGAGKLDTASMEQSGFVPLHRLVPFNRVDPEKLKDDAHGVACRIDLLGGAITEPGPAPQWTIDNRLLETQLHRGRFGWTTTWRIDGLTTGDLDPFRDLKPLRGGPPLQLPDAGTVSLTVENRPKGHHRLSDPERDQRDHHFRWFYEMVRDRNVLARKVRNNGLPIPRFDGWPATMKAALDDPNTHTCVGAWGEP